MHGYPFLILPQLVGLSKQVRTLRFKLDDVNISVKGPFLPKAEIITAAPGHAIQRASAYTNKPYHEFSLTAIPKGMPLEAEGITEAHSGSADSIRARLTEQRSGSPDLLRETEGPPATMFGQKIPGHISVLKLVVDGEGQKPIQIIEWVAETENRYWLARVCRELADSDQIDADFANAFKSLEIIADNLNVPTTIVPPAGDAHIELGHTGTRNTLMQSLGTPKWWNGVCDVKNFPGSKPLGANYQGLLACGPRHTLHVVQFFPGSWGEYEWQCVELVMRYMYLAYGIKPYGANGNQVYTHYSGTILQKVPNGGFPPAPLPGDVLSYGPTMADGHTSVCTAANIDAHGNGTVNVIEQNSSPNGANQLQVVKWDVRSNMTVIGWLHKP